MLLIFAKKWCIIKIIVKRRILLNGKGIGMGKQFSVNFIAQCIAFFVNMGVSFFLTPFIVENIGADANAFVGLANNFVDYAQLFAVALNSMAGRFITIKIHQKEDLEANKYFTSVFFANLALSAVFTVVFSVVIVFLDRFLNISASMVPDIKMLWILVFVNFILGLFASNYSVSTFIADRLDKTAFCNVRSYLLKAGILVACYTFFPPFTFYVGIAMVAMSLNNLITHVYLKKKLVPQLKVSKGFFDFRYIRELIASGIWNTVSKLSSILSSGLDLLITNLFVNEMAMGVLYLSKTMPTHILALFGTLAAIYAPRLTKLYALNDEKGMAKDLLSSVKLMGLLSALPIAVLFGFGHSFFTLWVPSQDAALLQTLTLITVFNLIFALPLEPLYNIFTVANKIKTSALALIAFSAASILTVFIGLNFITDETAKIIYIASVGAFYNVVRLLTFLPLYGAKCLKFKLSTFYPAIIKNVLAVAVLSAVGLGLNALLQVDSWWKLIVGCGLLCIIGLVLNLFILFTKDERGALWAAGRGILSKLKKS